MIRNVYILLFLSLIPLCSYGQKKKSINLAMFDDRPYHFGFYLALNRYDFSFRFADNFRQLDSVYVVEGKPQMGFNLGIVSNARLGNNFDVRLLPGLAFTERHIVYTMIYHDTTRVFETRNIESTFIDIPLVFKYKSDRLNNFRTYVLFGPKYSLDLASQKKIKETGEEHFIRLQRNDWSFDVGIGFDFYLEYFKFSPELKFSVGLKDILKRDPTIYTKVIDRLTTRAFTFVFNFE